MRSKSKVDFKFRCVVRASGARREAYFFCWSFICRLFPRVCLVFFPWLGRVLVAGGGGGDVAGRNWCSFRASESAFSARHWNIFVHLGVAEKHQPFYPASAFLTGTHEVLCIRHHPHAHNFRVLTGVWCSCFGVFHGSKYWVWMSELAFFLPSRSSTCRIALPMGDRA